MIEWKMITENAHSAANPSKRRTTATAADGQTTTGDEMITCSVCGHLNDPSAAICENCGSDLSDSPDWGGFDDDEW